MSLDKEEVFDFFTNAAVPREIPWGSDKKTFYFRRISGEQKLKLNRGQLVTLNANEKTAGTGGKHTMNVDMATFEEKRQMMVLFACCTDETGKTPLFKRLEDVQKLPDTAIALLAREAEEVNKEMEDPKKS